jgi:dCMP deaminase
MYTRPNWDTYFIQQAHLIATRGTCDRKHVGSVIVRDNRILATGYNGSLPGTPHCDSPAIYWQCSKCSKEFETKPKNIHSLSCAGYELIEKHGGHVIEHNHCILTIHAETNAIYQAARFGISLDKAKIYCNTFPCWRCFQAIVSAGIIEAIYDDDYPSENRNRVITIATELPNFVLRQFKQDN